MNKFLGVMATAAVLAFSTAADAHSLRLQCKKMTGDNVVCRTIASDGEIARDVEVLLIEDKDYSVLATAKTDTAGQYAFKAPGVEYHVVALGDKAHVASLSSWDIW
jgi:PP-loop superfamily ATP-utilizing enzyme